VQEIAVVGDPDGAETRRVLRAVHRGFHPGRVLALKPAAGAPEELDRTLPLLADRTAKGAVTTYVCQDFTCGEPLVGAEAAERALEAKA
jgi:uncharacterized protein